MDHRKLLLVVALTIHLLACFFELNDGSDEVFHVFANQYLQAIQGTE